MTTISPRSTPRGPRAGSDPRIVAALWCARGIVDLARGDFIEAEESLQRAAQLAAGDPLCRAALAAVYRAGKRYDQLETMLAQLASSLTSPDARAIAGREHAELLAEHLGNAAGARDALERLIKDRPDDADAILSLAHLCDRDQLWDRSIALYQRAIPLVAPARRSDLWIEVAHRQELAAAIPMPLARRDRSRRRARSASPPRW